MSIAKWIGINILRMEKVTLGDEVALATLITMILIPIFIVVGVLAIHWIDKKTEIFKRQIEIEKEYLKKRFKI